MKHIIISIAILALSLPAAYTAHAEYIRATNEDELIFVSTESEVKMGKSISKKAEKQHGLDDDICLRQRIEEIGQKIASACDRKDITYHFNILKGDDLEPEQRVNAFAIPGGYIYVFKDMIKLLESDDEIAGVLAHEVGHIAAKHSIKRLQASYGAMILQILSTGMASDSNTRLKTHAALGLLMTSYSREEEAMADRLAVRYVKKAGYDPEAILKTIDKMADAHRKAPIRRYTAYRTHPYLAERKAAAKKEIFGRIDFIDFINTPTNLGEN